MSRRDDSLDDPVVEKALADPRRRPVGDLDLPEHPVVGIAVRNADPELVHQVGRGQAGFRGEPVPGGQRDVERLPHQRDHGEAAFLPARQGTWGVRDDDVEVRGEIGEVGQQRILIAADDLEPWQQADGREEAGQQHLTGRRECRERDLAARSVAEVLPERVGPLERHRHFRGGLSELAAGSGENDAAAGALGQCDSGLSLEHFQLL